MDNRALFWVIALALASVLGFSYLSTHGPITAEQSEAGREKFEDLNAAFADDDSEEPMPDNQDASLPEQAANAQAQELEAQAVEMQNKMLLVRQRLTDLKNSDNAKTAVASLENQLSRAEELLNATANKTLNEQQLSLVQIGSQLQDIEQKLQEVIIQTN